MINLGYLYEYGHLGEPDYEASFKQFAKVMALGDFPEAIYKVGDAYSRARVVERDLRIEVVNDSPWYAERLEQAIAGQIRARSLMDEMGVDLAAKHRMFLP